MTYRPCYYLSIEEGKPVLNYLGKWQIIDYMWIATGNLCDWIEAHKETQVWVCTEQGLFPVQLPYMSR